MLPLCIVIRVYRTVSHVFFKFAQDSWYEIPYLLFIRNVRFKKKRKLTKIIRRYNGRKGCKNFNNCKNKIKTSCNHLLRYNNMIRFCIKWKLGKKSELQMGFQPMTLHDLVGCSNHWSYRRIHGEQGWNVGLWLDCITAWCVKAGAMSLWTKTLKTRGRCEVN